MFATRPYPTTAMTTARLPARYSAMEGARAGSLATAQLHHQWGHDPGPCQQAIGRILGNIKPYPCGQKNAVPSKSASTVFSSGRMLVKRIPERGAKKPSGRSASCNSAQSSLINSLWTMTTAVPVMGAKYDRAAPRRNIREHSPKCFSNAALHVRRLPQDLGRFRSCTIRQDT
jgi:hypothetical protein